MVSCIQVEAPIIAELVTLVQHLDGKDSGLHFSGQRTVIAPLSKSDVNFYLNNVFVANYSQLLYPHICLCLHLSCKILSDTAFSV